jgi:hypothetical protein
MNDIVQTCPIWGTTAAVRQGPDSLVVDSPRAGGKYRVTGSAVPTLSNFAIEVKVRLTWWLVEQRRQGDACPEITSYTFDRVRNLPMPSIVERRDRILDFIASRSPTIGTRIQFAGLVTEQTQAVKAALAAHTSSQSDGEVNELIQFAIEDQLVESPEALRLTFKAWTYIEERRARQIASVQGFVAMWFAPAMEPAYERGFAPAIRVCGYEPMRIDRKEHINKIDDEIIAEIRRSRFLVADFTSEPDRPRGGVYFEAGFAFGPNIPVIWSCREDLVGQLHFDIRQFNHIVWANPDDLHLKLKNRIGAVLGDGPGRSTMKIKV